MIPIGTRILPIIKWSTEGVLLTLLSTCFNPIKYCMCTITIAIVFQYRIHKNQAMRDELY